MINRSTENKAALATLLGVFLGSCSHGQSTDIAMVQRISSVLVVEVEPPAVDFGLLEVGETASLPIALRNTSAEPILIHLEVVPQDPSREGTITVESLSGPLLLDGDGEGQIVTTFSPRAEGMFSVIIRISVEDSDGETVDVPVQGSAALDVVAIGEPASPCDDPIGPHAIIGTPRDDVLVGTPGDDVIVGLGGNDVIEGLAGNDVLCGGPGIDQLIGGDGNDQLDGGRGDDTATKGGSLTGIPGGLFGGPGDDILWGRNGHDLLQGDDVSGTLRISNGNDRLFGGAGNDCLFGGPGTDLLNGGPGDDRLDGGVGNDILAGAGDTDQLHGGFGNDVLAGGDDNDFLFGEDGDDELFGGSGVDVLRGGNGNDVLKGGDDGDFLYGQEGEDTLFAGAGQDRVEGGPGDDTIDAGLDGAFWPAVDQEPGDSFVGESIGINFQPLDPLPVRCGT